ncbi:MAG: hypothetical protein ACXWD8_05740, partial [Mycobacterium sp.]
ESNPAPKPDGISVVTQIVYTVMPETLASDARTCGRAPHIVRGPSFVWTASLCSPQDSGAARWFKFVLLKA